MTYERFWGIFAGVPDPVDRGPESRSAASGWQGATTWQVVVVPETIEAGTRVLQDLAERDFSKVDVLIIYLDGIQFGNHHVLAAVGVDEDGKKYVLGVRSGASENATVTTALLEDLVARGIRPDRRRRFVVDGAKALRSAIAQVFGAGNEGQRCRNHTLRNVVGHLPNAQHDQARATLRAAWKLEAQEGMRKLDQYASWLQRDWPDAAASVREGLDEIFTVNRLGLPASLRTCLTTAGANARRVSLFAVVVSGLFVNVSVLDAQVPSGSDDVRDNDTVQVRSTLGRSPSFRSPISLEIRQTTGSARA